MKCAPVLGGTLPRGAARTAGKLTGFALRHASAYHSYLDVGCGNGYMTEIVGADFSKVVGIDVEPERLADFREHANENGKVSILEMSASSIAFPDNSFSLVTAFEVLEHVPDPQIAASQMARVCSPGGTVVISVPQRWFPFENHGMQIGSRTYERKIPLLPYMRPLHSKWSLARIFSSSEMDSFFSTLTPIATEYASPQFERAATKPGWERNLRFLRGVLDRCESIPIIRALCGVSMLKAYRKNL